MILGTRVVSARGMLHSHDNIGVMFGVRLDASGVVPPAITSFGTRYRYRYRLRTVIGLFLFMVMYA